LTLDRRCELVEQFRDELGLNACLLAMGISKGTWYPRQKRPKGPSPKDQELVDAIREVIEEHPEYGYRKLKPDVEEILGEAVNHKRLRRVLKQWGLGLRRLVSNFTPSPIRTLLDEAAGVLNLVKGWDPAPLELLSVDFTEIHFDEGRRKAHLIALIDVGSRMICGWAVGRSADRALALRSWKKARDTLAEMGRTMAGMVVHSDQDSVFTSYAWLRELMVTDSVIVSFSERGAKDNPWIESFWSHFKRENASLLIEASSLEELEEIIARRMAYYNRSRRHESLGQQPPVEFLIREGIIEETLSAA